MQNFTASIKKILGFVALVAVVAGTFAGSMSSASAAEAGIPTEGALWGSSSQWVKNYPLEARVDDLEVQLDSELQAIRLYHFWEERFPTYEEQWLLESDTVPVISVDTRRPDWSRAHWADIAVAAPGDGIYENIVRWADDFKAYGRPIIASLNHEPDFYKNGGNGKPADYVAAYRRFVQILDEQGADNVSTMFIGVAWNFDPRSANPIDQWYPGDDVVDYAGVDGYNWGGCYPGASGWRSFDQIFGAFRTWAQDHDTRWLIGEFGAVEDAERPHAKATWYREAAETMASPEWDRLDVVLYWNRTHESKLDCHFRLDSSYSALDGARDLAKAPVFRGATTSSPATTAPAPSTTVAPAPTTTAPAPTTTVAPTTTTAAPTTTTAPAPTTTVAPAPTTTAPAPTTTVAPAPTTTTPAPTTTVAPTTTTTAPAPAPVDAHVAESCPWSPDAHHLDANHVEILTAVSSVNPNL